MKRRIRVTVSYDGSEYHGWQIQPGLPTIQGILEQAISEIEGSKVHVTGSGRTDAGVHALAQVAAFDLTNPIPPDNLRRALNRVLPHDIRILSVDEAVDGFHPRHQASSKLYEYRMYRAEICPPFLRRYVHHHPYPLDETRFMECAAIFEGEHDFTAFAAADDRDALGHSKVRRIFSSRAVREDELLIYRVKGSGFLKHMVRNMVGVMIEAGKGNLTPEGLRERLTPGCTIPPGPTAPARGLFLVEVSYDSKI